MRGVWVPVHFLIIEVSHSPKRQRPTFRGIVGLSDRGASADKESLIIKGRAWPHLAN